MSYWFRTGSLCDKENALYEPEAFIAVSFAERQENRVNCAYLFEFASWEGYMYSKENLNLLVFKRRLIIFTLKIEWANSLGYEGDDKQKCSWVGKGHHFQKETIFSFTFIVSSPPPVAVLH